MKSVEKQWFVVQTYSGFENNVKENLERRIGSMNMEDKIFRVLVPTETTQEEVTLKSGEKKIKEKEVKSFPGYVFVEMIMTDDSWYVVRNTPNVTGFLGSTGGGAKPIPLQPDEVTNVLSQMVSSRRKIVTTTNSATSSVSKKAHLRTLKVRLMKSKPRKRSSKLSLTCSAVKQKLNLISNKFRKLTKPTCHSRERMVQSEMFDVVLYFGTNST